VVLISPRQKLQGIDENDSYLRIGRYLHAQGIPVPGILWADVAKGWFVLEDLGDCHLQRRATRGRIDQLACYRSVIGLLAKLHERAAAGFDMDFCFDTPVYSPEFVFERELEYFRLSFLIGCLGLEVSASELRDDFHRLAETAGVRIARQVIHRDFQSRNLMIWRGALRLIDFQGMRFGPSVYDLASLLVDPYVRLPNRIQDELVRMYWQKAHRFLGCSLHSFRQHYVTLRLARNLQILGAYGFLGIAKGKTGFLRYIPAAWQSLLGWLHGPCRGMYPALQRVIAGASQSQALRHPARGLACAGAVPPANPPHFS
jgi:hypothetical protein